MPSLFPRCASIGGTGGAPSPEQIEKGSDMNGYIAHWQGKRVEVYADTLYGAQCEAVKVLQAGTRRKVKGHEVSVMLAEKDGVPVVHVAS